MGVVLYNLLLLAAELFALRMLRKRPTAGTALAALFSGGFFALFLGGMLGGGFFGVLALWAWAVFLHGPVLLTAFGALLWKTSRAAAWTSIALAGLTAAVGVDAFLVEPSQLELTRVKVESPKLKRPLRIGVLSDLQTDKVGEHEERALRALMAEKPDLILLPGDFVQAGPRQEEVEAEVHELFRRVGVTAPLGVFAVQGDMDREGWPRIFDGLGVTCLEKTGAVEVDGLRLTGLSFGDGNDPGRRVSGSELFHVVFAHRPDFALGEVKADLLVAGHTHGGQVRLPGIGPIVTMSRIPRAWAAGATRLEGGRTLVVTRGVGMERGPAPRLRFLCRPEIVVIDAGPSR